MKKWILTLLIICFGIQAYAFEDYVINSDGKLTQIWIEDNKIVDIYPLITIMNEKNTLIVHPLKEGETTFSIVKNGKQKTTFYVRVDKDKTYVSPLDGYNVLSIDLPPQKEDLGFLDMPPKMKKEVE